MEHSDQSQRIDMYAPNSSSPALRWVIRIMLIICGLLIVTVLLSQPGAKTYVQGSLKQMNGIFASFMPDKDQPKPVALIADTNITTLEETPDPKASKPKRPSVLAMPTSRIPIRRIVLTRED